MYLGMISQAYRMYFVQLTIQKPALVSLEVGSPQISLQDT